MVPNLQSISDHGVGVTFGSLFAGIGGFDLGLERAGMRCAWQVELDPDCRGVLREHFHEPAQLADIADAPGGVLAPVDLICGGFPCQDLSIAGKRAGLAGARSGLFYEMARVCDELRPAWILWENVPGLLSSPTGADSVAGADFLAVLAELDRLGYAGAWTTLDAQHFGLAQARTRVFGLFTRGSAGAQGCAEILAIPARLRGSADAGGAAGQDAPAGNRNEAARGGRKARALTAADGRHGHGSPRGDGPANLVPVWLADPITASEGKTYTHEVSTFRMRNVVPTVSAKWAKGTGGPAGDECGNLVPILTPTVRGNRRNNSDAASEVRMHASARRGLRRLTPRECERLQGFPDDWTIATARRKHLTDSPRYRMIGNAVPPPIAWWIGTRLREYVENQSSPEGT